MGYFNPKNLPRDPDAAQARRDARAVLLVTRARLGAGEAIDPQALHALTEDERLTPRLRVRAAEYLARAWIDGTMRAAGLPWKGPGRP